MAAGGELYPDTIEGEQELERLLSEPSPDDVAWAGRLRGDLIILGAAGKMGPSLTMLARRAVEAAGSRSRVLAVFRKGHDAVAQRPRIRFAKNMRNHTSVCKVQLGAFHDAFPEIAGIWA